MNPAIAANQQRLFLAFVAELRPHVRRDSSLPRRIKELFGRHRAIGSRDRKLYRELVYTWLRYLPWIDPLLDKDADTAAKLTAWLAPELKPTAHYRAALCGEWPATPASLAEKSAILAQLIPGLAFNGVDLLPSWFLEHCPDAFAAPHLDAINTRANVWVRIQANDRNLVLNEFKAQGWDFEQPSGFPDAVRLPPNAEVATSDAYRRGFVEIQDFGSQLVLAHAPAPLAGRWLDACAGAGGKTLQLARLLDGRGQVDATDIRMEILEELRERAKRARLDNVSILKEPKGTYDGILVDAPCSGSGTWRRQPHLKWYVKPESIAAFAKTQLEILRTNAPRLKPGGLMIYATCSMSRQENHDLVHDFLRQEKDFLPDKLVAQLGGKFDGVGTTLLPGTLDTDGFYVAVLRRS